MSLWIAKNVARDVGLRVRLIATGLPNTATAMNALLTARSPGGANNGFYWRADTAAWQAGLPTFGATQWLPCTHEADGRWRCTVPAGAPNALAIGDSMELIYADNATPALGLTYSESVDLQIVSTYSINASWGGSVAHTLRARNGTLAGDPPPPGSVNLGIFDSSNTTWIDTVATDGSGNATVNLVAGDYVCRPQTMAGWGPTAATTAFTAAAAGSTVIPGTNITIPASSAGFATVQFEVKGNGVVRANKAITVKLWPPGQRFAVNDATPDLLGDYTPEDLLTNGSGIATVSLPQGCTFLVDSPALGEDGRTIYKIGSAVTAVNFAELRQTQRR